MGYFISSLADNMMSAAQYTPFAVMPSVLVGGFVSNVKGMPVYIAWFQYCSPTRFAFEALIWAQWPEQELGLQKHFGFELGYWPCIFYLLLMVLVYRLATYLLLCKISRTNQFR